MKHTIGQFTRVLRTAGIPVSTAEVLDCVSALSLVDNYNRRDFKVVIQSHLIKSQRHVSKFDRCFELFFDRADPDKALEELESGDTSITEDVPNDRSQELEDRFLDHEESMENETWRFLLKGDERILNTIEEMQQGVGLESKSVIPRQYTGIYALGRSLEIMQAINRVRDDLDRFFSRQISEETNERSIRAIERQKRTLGRKTSLLREILVGDESRRIFQSRIQKNSLSDQDGISNKSLASLDREEKEKLFDLMKILIRKVNTSVSLRLRGNRQGKIDIKKTFRESLHYGGTPMKLHFRDKTKRKGDIVALCDVSRSVYAFTRIMLTLIYAISAQFKQIRSFAFIAGITEITRCMQSDRLEEALEKTLKETGLTKQPGSDYGKTFREFDENFIQTVGPRTTVIVMGDARNNGNLTEHRILEKIYKKAKRVIWLNPENHIFWNNGDSEFTTYLPYCTEFRECRTYHQLEEFILKLAS